MMRNGLSTNGLPKTQNTYRFIRDFLCKVAKMLCNLQCKLHYDTVAKHSQQQNTSFRECLVFVGPIKVHCFSQMYTKHSEVKQQPKEKTTIVERNISFYLRFYIENATGAVASLLHSLLLVLAFLRKISLYYKIQMAPKIFAHLITLFQCISSLAFVHTKMFAHFGEMANKKGQYMSILLAIYGRQI